MGLLDKLCSGDRVDLGLYPLLKHFWFLFQTYSSLKSPCEIFAFISCICLFSSKLRMLPRITTKKSRVWFVTRLWHCHTQRWNISTKAFTPWCISTCWFYWSEMFWMDTDLSVVKRICVPREIHVNFSSGGVHLLLKLHFLLSYIPEYGVSSY